MLARLCTGQRQILTMSARRRNRIGSYGDPRTLTALPASTRKRRSTLTATIRCLFVASSTRITPERNLSNGGVISAVAPWLAGGNRVPVSMLFLYTPQEAKTRSPHGQGIRESDADARFGRVGAPSHPKRRPPTPELKRDGNGRKPRPSPVLRSANRSGEPLRLLTVSHPTAVLLCV